MRFLYTLLLGIAAPFLLFSLYRKKDGKPKVGKRWVEHFGFSPPLNQKPQNENSLPIWIHAVSVGEVIAAKPVILALRKNDPSRPIVLTTTTPTGAEIARTLGDDIEHRYMPIDFNFAVTQFIKRIKPSILIIMETELWPNTLFTAKKNGIPVFIINARLSHRAMKGYQRIQPLFSSLSKNITQILCQSKADLERFKSLGIPDSALCVCGSVKFDLPIFNEENSSVLTLKKELSGRSVWIAASTHEGEDEVLLQAHKKILKHTPHALMILVPRHPERFNEVAKRVEENGFSLARRSIKQKPTSNIQLYLGDTLGEMMTLFSVSDCAFMAGSLLGNKVGGHNLLEPASLGKPLLTGPSFYNFQSISEELIENGACTVCRNEDDIAHKIISLFENKNERTREGAAALQVIEKNRGAVSNTLRILSPWLQK